MLDSSFDDNMGLGVVDRPIRRRQGGSHIVSHPNRIGHQKQLH
jgi:hypothetical protein